MKNEGDENRKHDAGKEFSGKSAPQPQRMTACPPRYDGYGRDVSRWIDVGGKLKPHP